MPVFGTYKHKYCKWISGGKVWALCLSSDCPNLILGTSRLYPDWLLIVWTAKTTWNPIFANFTIGGRLKPNPDQVFMLCSASRQIGFVSQIRSFEMTVRTVICKWSDQICVFIAVVTAWASVTTYLCWWHGFLNADAGEMEVHHFTFQTLQNSLA